jgi:hypothetical protein
MIKTFDASKINWINNNGRVDASDLGLKADEVPYTQFDSSNGVGPNSVMVLKLVNKKKGTECIFQLRDSNSCGWGFVSVDGKIGLTIFND